ncbi:MAG TPA: PAS domain-containing protein [Algoriphagus sp.]|jgi:PAS domain-containing protein|uniref:PAS domain-containing protein n=1 Tax=Algoriphagus ornithinivorans TaxID=226506 RepID=A0A1I5A6T9_9BACT|nr:MULTISPECIES: PAS domain-containing protein [Algoriphagus]MAL12428.1 PAS domain-containing protein [Algoriphagus sp.]MAN88297.1 PAS domain-containing protein [Algoriphagus sp.]SFN58192.1 PAS domain-containing protein [Algoriphagus ornithinivorans]HAD50418.1 PAS domain-containing protein [Algoriphagus sp.]HAS58786.1 PAS domain-containing protein [Algoriphagus sp.]|tara:strand:- start:289 stop:684 length:396 start_codon:yes stop_codon:yes gene_type:complete
MPAQALELILGRQFVDSLSMPAFLVDTEGNLLFYNEPAEQIFGLRFGETGGMRVEEWSTIFTPTDKDGKLLPPEGLPLVKTLTSKEPAHGSFYIDNLNGERIFITVTAFPIIGRPDRYLGAMAMFWKSEML